MYRLCLNASSFSYRVLTGACAHCVRRCPPGRHEHALPEAAVDGTCVRSVASAFHGSKKVSARAPTNIT